MEDAIAILSAFLCALFGFGYGLKFSIENPGLVQAFLKKEGVK